MSIRIELDDVNLISNDIEEAQEIVNSNFCDGELSECEEYLDIDPQAARETIKFLASAISILNEALSK